MPKILDFKKGGQVEVGVVVGSEGSEHLPEKKTFLSGKFENCGSSKCCVQAATTKPASLEVRVPLNSTKVFRRIMEK